MQLFLAENRLECWSGPFQTQVATGKWNEKLNFRRRHEAILKLMRSMGESPAATEPEERQKTYSINPPNPIVISKGDAEKLSEMREKRRSWIAENKQFIQQSLFE